MKQASVTTLMHACVLRLQDPKKKSKNLSKMPTQFDLLPLLKVLMHAAKHPHLSVNGVLLGTTSGPAGDVQVSDSIPLFHNSLALAAPTEIALTLVSSQ